jgi:DNA-binding CsgD family transcriptional regulator
LLGGGHPADAVPMRLISDMVWNTALGAAAQSIGRRDFHKTLLSLFGMLIEHDMTFIARYSRFSSIEFLHYEGVPHHIVELFREKYHRFDPFYAWWRDGGEPGVVTQRMVSPGRLRNSPYRRIFQRQAHIRDEMCMFLPVIGGASIGLFLERSDREFTAAEARRARSVYPVIAGLYRAHLARLFSSLGDSPGSRVGKMLLRPTMLTDRSGRRVFANKAWRDAEASEANLAEMLRSLQHTGKAEVALPNGQVLVSEPVGDDFPVAPQGRVYLIERRGVAPVRELPKPVSMTHFGEGLTAREQQITALILQGFPTETIARKLGIGRGTVKNHRRRLYYKLDITSERELFLR